MLNQIKGMQKRLKEIKPFDSAFSKFLHHIVYDLKQIGRLIYYFGLINEEVCPKENQDFNRLNLIKLREKSPEFIHSQIQKFNSWKLKRWKAEFKEFLEYKELSEVTIICKICLQKVPSNRLNYHSSKCLKRAESHQELKELLKSIPKYIVVVQEIKQCLITKAKYHM